MSKKSSRIGWFLALALIAAGGILGYLEWSGRSPFASAAWKSWFGFSVAEHHSNADGSTSDPHDHGGHGEASHDHGHDHDHDATSLTLSIQAQRSLGLTPENLLRVKFETYRRSLTVPGRIVERPGRTRVQVSTPISGVITHVHAVQGEAVPPGTVLFQIRITAAELVETQTELLKTVGELDVETREIERLKAISEQGALSQKTLLERQYTKEKLEALLGAQREALRLHGLSETQVEEMVTKRRLLRELRIVAPDPDSHSMEELKLSDRGTIRPVVYFASGDDEVERQIDAHDEHEATTHPLILQDVRVHKGQTVAAGETLCVMADYGELYIEGQAFEQDAGLLANAAIQQWPVSAIIDHGGNETKRIDDLQLIYSASEIETESRTLPFYVRLPNTIARDTPSPNGQRFIDWQYRPGQRLQLQVPVEEWSQQIVLPADAVAREGAENFVFRAHGEHFDRAIVHVRHRDAQSVVIANDGILRPGQMIARTGAHQLLMALKQKASGPVDPHAGHNH